MSWIEDGELQSLYRSNCGVLGDYFRPKGKRMDHVESILRSLPPNAGSDLKELLRSIQSECRKTWLERPSWTEFTGLVRWLWNQMGKDKQHSVLEELAALLRHEDKYLAHAVKNLLIDIGSDSVPYVVNALRKRDLEHPQFALDVIATCSDHCSDYVPLIEQFIEHDQLDVRLKAIECAGAIGRAASSCIPQLIAMLQDDATETIILCNVAEALGAMKAVAAVAPLCEVLSRNGNDGRVRSAVIRGLFGIGSIGRRKLPLLLRSQFENARNKEEARVQILLQYVDHFEPIEDEYKTFCADVIHTVRTIGPGAVPLLIDLLADADSMLKREICSAIAEIGPESRPATCELHKLLSAADVEVQLAAADALCAITSVDEKGESLSSARAAAKETLAGIAYNGQLNMRIRVRAMQKLAQLDETIPVIGESASIRFELELEAIDLVGKMLLFKKVVHHYKQGAKSFQEVADRLRDDLNLGRNADGTPISPPQITRCVKKLNGFFAKVFNDAEFTSFTAEKGLAARRTQDADKALAWIEEFLLRRKDLIGRKK